MVDHFGGGSALKPLGLQAVARRIKAKRNLEGMGINRLLTSARDIQDNSAPSARARLGPIEVGAE